MRKSLTALPDVNSCRYDLQKGLIEVDAVKDMDGVTTETFVPDIANHVPTLKIAWDDKKIKHTNDSFHEAMRNGHPSIEVAGWGSDNSIQITTWMLVPGQERVVAERVRQTLTEAKA